MIKIKLIIIWPFKPILHLEKIVLKITTLAITAKKLVILDLAKHLMINHELINVIKTKNCFKGHLKAYRDVLFFPCIFSLPYTLIVQCSVFIAIYHSFSFVIES